MVMCSTRATGHDLRPSVILLLRSDEIDLHKQYMLLLKGFLVKILELVGHLLLPNVRLIPVRPLLPGVL